MVIRLFSASFKALQLIEKVVTNIFSAHDLEPLFIKILDQPLFCDDCRTIFHLVFPPHNTTMMFGTVMLKVELLLS